MKKQNYINWEVINQKEYRKKITTCTEKLNDQQKELFKEILNCIKNAGGADRAVLHMLLEEADDSEYKEQKLQLLLEYLNKNIKLEQTVSELEFYRKKAQGAEEKNRLLKKEMIGLKAKKHELEDTLTEYQKRLSLAEEENNNRAEQREVLLQIQKNMEQVMADSRKIKELLTEDKVVVKRDNNVTITESNMVKREKEGENKCCQSVNQNENSMLPECHQNDSQNEEKRTEEERKIEEENTAEYIEDMDEAFYEEFQGIALENAIDPEEYGTFMEAAPGEILYYPLEEEDETEEEFEEAGKNQRVNFFNSLLEKMDFGRFQKLKSSEQLSKMFESLADRQISREEKKVFMKLIQESEKEDYVKIYQYIKEGREKELLKEEWYG